MDNDKLGYIIVAVICLGIIVMFPWLLLFVPLALLGVISNKKEE